MTSNPSILLHMDAPDEAAAYLREAATGCRIATCDSFDGLAAAVAENRAEVV